MVSLLSHNDYTVAWICALPLEMAAAKAMLDDIHLPLSQPLTDDNAYTLGKLCGHNVVIACLPSGIYGVNSAARVLAQMLPTFPSLRFGLMVGIGGGVPNEVDIRLGDVVVSKPTATTGGVIQFDLGKTLSAGRFERIGVLNKPPQVLLTAISQMESDHMTGKRQIQKIINDALGKNEEMKDQFSRPRDDWLFHATYNHQSTARECSACDPHQLINRPPRVTDEPYIHYGLIASGNQVMKDAQTRDQVAKELDILCFEMEAAGLMDQLPCLVIRGICDYCDTHKHERWQGYAAMTSAAYVRGLLTTVPINDQRKHKKAREQLWLVPFARNLQFAGRLHEMTELQKLLSMRDGPRNIALTGLGGVGKSQVALELAYRMRDCDPECSVFWVPSMSHESVEQAYMSIAQCLSLQDVNPADVKIRVKTHLSHKNAGKWLLIYDNADDIKMWVHGNDTAPVLKSFLPKSDQGCIIFTTRNRKIALSLAPSNVIPIPEMDETTARKLLESLTHKDLHENRATSLLQQLTFLPLAITQAAAYINANGIELDEYLGLLRPQEQNIVELLSEDFEDEGRYDEIQNPVATTWWISFCQIQQTNQLALDYLAFMACINPRNIPQSLLPPATSRKEMIDALGLLNAYSFTSKQEDGSFSLHRLVHLATRNWMRKKELLNEWAHKTADRFDELFQVDDHTNRSLWRKYMLHVLFLIEGKEFHDIKEDYVSLLQKVGKCLYSDERYNEAGDIFDNVVNMQKRKNGMTHPSTLSSMADLASTYLNQGHPLKALEIQDSVMAIYKQMLAELDCSATSMRRASSTYSNPRQSQGEDIQAQVMEIQTQVMEIHKQQLGLEHPDTLTSMAWLASIFCNQRRFEEAEMLQVKVVKTQKKVLGPEHPSTLISMRNLKHTQEFRARDEAVTCSTTNCIEPYTEHLGSDHSSSMTARTRGQIMDFSLSNVSYEAPAQSEPKDESQWVSTESSTPMPSASETNNEVATKASKLVSIPACRWKHGFLARLFRRK